MTFFFLAVVNVEMKSGDLWVLANINITGYYRVNYDLGNWERLIDQLTSDHEVHIQASSVAVVILNVFKKKIYIYIFQFAV